MANLGLVKSYNAGAAITAFTIVKPGAADYDVLPAAAGADFAIGVTRNFPSLIGEPVDVIHDGIALVKTGAVVVRGAMLMSDASGFAITAAAAAGVNVRVIGTALISGAAGDVIPVLIDIASFQG